MDFEYVPQIRHGRSPASAHRASLWLGTLLVICLVILCMAVTAVLLYALLVLSTDPSRFFVRSIDEEAASLSANSFSPLKTASA